jgi:hypothetical protein
VINLKFIFLEVKEMSYKVALLCMHGMGNVKEKDFMSEIQKIRQNLAKRLSPSKFSEIYIPPQGIFYSNLTQTSENKVWDAMQGQGGLDTGFIRRNTVNKFRSFIISGFSDATAFCGSNSVGGIQPYTQVQELIYKALVDIYKNCGDIPVVILSHSLGCQIMSNYIWDSQCYLAGLPINNPYSFWHPNNLANDESPRTKNGMTDKLSDYFMCLRSLKCWFTTGCNIPIFVSGFKDVRAVHNKQGGYNFDWFNFFDYDDPLGYPLAPLGVLFNPPTPPEPQGYGQPYSSNMVTDIQINANDGILGSITTSWNPFAHTQYWNDDEFLDKLAQIF